MNQEIAETSTDRMACLEEENARLREENERLRGMLGMPPGAIPEADVEAGRLFPEDDPLPQVDARSPAQEKIALFRALFRGREDVYARYWCDERSGKKAYSPAARNRSGRGAKDYLPLTDEVLYRHLAGEEIVGLYPLLRDDTCRLLACDFDGPTWAADALGFLEAADRWRVPAYLERSRFGQGGHVWIFFTRLVSAVHARRLGTGLLRETMVARGELELTSYDRLFPNQDFMPKGGFGNLIALPLQKRARALGNTEFLDRELRPWPDAWRGLSLVRRLTPDALEALLGELPPMEVGVEGSTLPSRWGRSVPEPPAPKSIRCVRGARLSLERSGLPPSLLARIKHIACLHNPEFHKRQKLRLSVYGTPRFVRCYEEDLTHLVESLERELVVRETAFDPNLGDDAPIQDVYRALAEDGARNRRICDDVREVVAGGRNCIVLTEWREHLDRLAAMLETSGVRAIALHGGVKKKERLARVAELNAASLEEPVLVLATGALVGEGFDLPRLDTLVLAFPISFRGRVIQYAGRILRSHPAKTAVTVYDYRDGLVPVLARMQTRRQKTLEGVGFVRDARGVRLPAGHADAKEPDVRGSR